MPRTQLVDHRAAETTRSTRLLQPWPSARAPANARQAKAVVRSAGMPWLHSAIKSCLALACETTAVGADCAVAVVLGVPGALLGAARACADTGLEQAVNDQVVGLGGPREGPCREVAHICAGQAERDARAHHLDVRLGEIRVRAGCARLETVQAGVYRCRDVFDSERHAGRRRVQHVARVGHDPARAFPVEPNRSMCSSTTFCTASMTGPIRRTIAYSSGFRRAGAPGWCGTRTAGRN